MSVDSGTPSEGETPSNVWWIERGLVRLCFLTAEGLERNKSFHAEGQWIGSGMPPVATPSPYGIEALEDSRVLELSYQALADAIRLHPAVRHLHVEALGWAFARQVTREAELLSDGPAVRYARFLAAFPEVAARVPLQHVASHLGITNVALSRIRRRMGLTRS